MVEALEQVAGYFGEEPFDLVDVPRANAAALSMGGNCPSCTNCAPLPGVKLNRL